ncbi:ribonuclease H-like domain-containing protein [Tanacetum coccineum]
MSVSQEEIPPPPPSSQTPTQQTPHTVSTIKLSILKKGEYDIWAMKMEHNLAHTDYPIWELYKMGIVQYPTLQISIRNKLRFMPPRTAEEIIARERERKARTTLLMALPEDHLAKFHKMTDAKEIIKGTQDNRRRDAWNSGNKDGSRTVQKEDSKALVTIDGEGVDWTNHSEDEDYALMACKSSDSDTEDMKGSNTAEGMHAVPPPMTGNYMPSGPDVEIDDSKFTYGPKQTQPSESESQSSEFDTCESNISAEPSELVSEPVVNESNVECQPKVWSDAPIIEEYESDSEDECVSIPTKQQETPSFANKQVKTPRETVKNQYTHSQKPKVDKTELGYGFTVRACFVCGSLNHLIRDCDFHEKRMARKAELNNGWNNVQRVNKQNQFLVLLGEKGKLLLSPQQVVIGDHKDTTGTISPNTMVDPILEIDYPHRALKNKGIVDSGCSRHMTRNKAYLAEFQDFNGGPVAFGGSKGYITGKGKIKTGKLDFEDVCFVKELQHFNLFSVSQMCDKKNKVLFTDSECLVLSSEFKLPDENQVLLKIPRQNNMYSFNLENIVPSGGLACLIAKATTDESNKWHRRLGHVNFKNLNKLVKGNLVKRVIFTTSSMSEGVQSPDFTNMETVVNLIFKSKRELTIRTFIIVYLLVSCLNMNPRRLWPSYSSTITPALTIDDKREGPREEEQVFMDDLERLKRQERRQMRKLKLSERIRTASRHEGLILSDPYKSGKKMTHKYLHLMILYQNATDGISSLLHLIDDEEIQTQQFKQEAKKSSSGAHSFVANVQKQKKQTIRNFHHCLFALFSCLNMNPRRFQKSLEDE